MAGRVDESTLHDTQFSPKGSLVYSFTPNHTMRADLQRGLPGAQLLGVLPARGGRRRRSPASRRWRTPWRRSSAGRTLGLRSIPVLALGNDETWKSRRSPATRSATPASSAARLFMTVDYYQSEIENFVTDLLPGVNPEYTGYHAALVPAGPGAPRRSSARCAAAWAPNFGGLTTLNGQPTAGALLRQRRRWWTPRASTSPSTTTSPTTGSWTRTTRGSTSRSRSASSATSSCRTRRRTSSAPAWPTAASVFGASVKYRWVESSPGPRACSSASCPPTTWWTSSATYRITDNVQVGVDVSNVLDDEHYQSFGGDLLTRRALGHVTFSW